MTKRAVTTRARHKRTNIVHVRMSDHEKEITFRRQKASKFKTPSAFLRALAIAGRDPKMPDWEEIRRCRNTMVGLTEEIRRAPSSRARDRAMDKATDAFEQFTILIAGL